MKKAGYNRPALLLGFILGGYFEEYFWLALQTKGSLFFLRPASMVIIFMTIGLYAMEPLKLIVNYLWRRTTA
jgi:TctA family transporter